MSPPAALELPAGVTQGYVTDVPDERISSGDPALDELSGGGFPRGRLSEISGPLSSGRTSLAWSLLAAATARGEVAALVDPSDRFDPARGAASGIRLERLLWVRPRRMVDALAASEILLAARGFAVVVLDLADGMPRDLADRTFTAWPRLSRHAEASRATLVVLGLERETAGAAHLSIALARPQPLRPRHRLRRTIFSGIEGRAEIDRARRAAIAGRQQSVRFGSA